MEEGVVANATQSPPPQPPPPQFLKSNLSLNPSKAFNLRFTPLFLTFLFFFFTIQSKTSATLITPSNFLAYYATHCNDVVPESPITGSHIFSDPSDDEDNKKPLHFNIAYFTGGRQILPTTAGGGVSVSFRLVRNSILGTRDPHVVNLQATLNFRFPFRANLTWHRNLREIRFRRPKIPVRERALKFELNGFWSMSSGKVCMVGSGSGGVVSDSNAVLKLDFPVNFVNFSSLIRGVLESFNYKGSLGYFEPVSILGIPQFGEYKYTLIDKGDGNVCISGNNDDGENDNFHFGDGNLCTLQLDGFARSFELEYGSECGAENGGKCNPLGGGYGILPKKMMVHGIRCDNGGTARVLIGFSEAVSDGFGLFSYGRVFDPNTMLIGEGVWNEKKDRLCVVACELLNYKDSLAKSSVGDCSTRLRLRFPKTLTIRQRSTVVGQIWSNRTINDEHYFGRIGFHDSEKRRRGLPGWKYDYTVLDKVSHSCGKRNTGKRKGKTYPNGYSLDMRFDMLVNNGSRQISRGYASPLFIGNQLYMPYEMNNNHNGILNISYELSFTPTSDLKLLDDKLFFNESVQISAEGTYDNETGVLCMIGCRHLIFYIEKSINNDSLDCEILVNAQFSPLNEKGWRNVKGIIRSMRGKSDPLYFGPLELSSISIYTTQAADSLWRMDMEITMVLISNTLACVFVGLQLYHSKKHPVLVPFISIVMLAILTLGHMIPLLLNFEAMFMANHNRQNVFLGSGGWLEVNEIIVRLVTMIAFLLHIRLLQLTWSTRKSDGSHKSLWISEKRVICLSLPLYVGGALVAWYVHQIHWKNSYRSTYFQPRHMQYQQHYPLGDLKSYAGLILDSFLLPQIMFNLFLNAKEKALASPFYVGTTIVRLLPHAYDLFRAHSSTWDLDLSYIYANHRQGYYSTAWDIIIPVSALLFAALIYLQQRFGGRCILPKRFRDSEYEKVPMVNSEELQIN